MEVDDPFGDDHKLPGHIDYFLKTVMALWNGRHLIDVIEVLCILVDLPWDYFLVDLKISKKRKKRQFLNCWKSRDIYYMGKVLLLQYWHKQQNNFP